MNRRPVTRAPTPGYSMLRRMLRATGLWVLGSIAVGCDGPVAPVEPDAEPSAPADVPTPDVEPQAAAPPAADPGNHRPPEPPVQEVPPEWLEQNFGGGIDELRDPYTIEDIYPARGTAQSREASEKPRCNVVLGSLGPPSSDLASIEPVVERHLCQIEACYQQHLRVDPELAGRLETTWFITNGRVSNAKVFANSTGDDALASCVTRHIRTWRFPVDLEPDIRVTCPFILTPDPAP